MTTKRTLGRRATTIASAVVLAGAAVMQLDAAGPLIVLDGKPVLWANREVRGGPLNTATVTVAGGKRTVYYRVDTGPLGPISPAEGVRFTDRIFGEYTDIPTANIDFVNAGPILDPDTGLPMDVDATNIGKVLGAPTFQNPIIFDSDGAITGGGGVLGFYGVLDLEPDGSAVTEAFVVLNGGVLDPPLLSTTSFLGVFTHEFGHFAGPLDHQSINGSIALGLVNTAVTRELTAAQAFDLYAPFTETLFPFLYDGGPGTTVGFPDSGFFIATLDLDSKNSLSSLYPNLIYKVTRGSIDGDVFFRSGGAKVTVPGMNVIARRIGRGAYPPPPDTPAYPSPPAIDEDGVPSPPPGRPETDSLATASSAVTGLDFGSGGYRIQGLPLGFYEVMLQQLHPAFGGGSSVGPLSFQLPLPVDEQYFNLPKTSADLTKFTPVLAIPSVTIPKVDIEILGMDNAEPSHLIEAPSHSTVPTAQDIGALPARVGGRTTLGDPFQLRVNFGGGQFAEIHDLYKFQLTVPTLVYVSLEPKAGAGDLDLYVFRGNVNPNVVPISGVPRYSLTASSREITGAILGPGTWVIGVSAFDGEVAYHLRVVPAKP